MATDDVTPEEWRPVPEYEGLYEVSDQGQVRSVDRMVIYSDRRQRWYPGVMLRPAPSGKVVPHLCVALSVNGRPKTRQVHQLVMEAFVGPCPEGQQVRHGPGGSLDNRLVNLCYGTPKENTADRERDGTVPRGETHRHAKLTAVIVLDCRRRYAGGETQTALAAEFGVSVVCIHSAITGRSWSHIAGSVPAGQKRRGVRGTANHSAKLTPEIVRDARKRSAAGETNAVLAAEYGVTCETMRYAIKGATWAHI